MRISDWSSDVCSSDLFTINGEQVTVPVTQTRNSPDKSRIYGLELTAATRFSFLPKPPDGLGAKVSYNYADSNFETQDIRLGDEYYPVTAEVREGLMPPAGLSGYSIHVLRSNARRVGNGGVGAGRTR